MTKAVYEKYKNIMPVTDDRIVMTIQCQITQLSFKKAQEYRVKDPIGGSLYLFTDSDFPDKVLEIVPGTNAEDSVSTLYQAHPIFNSRTELMRARREMIEAIAAANLALPSVIGVPDAGRERDVLLAEHGTAQLIDHMKRMFA
jgi:hypothetical protein